MPVGVVLVSVLTHSVFVFIVDFEHVNTNNAGSHFNRLI